MSEGGRGLNTRPAAGVTGTANPLGNLTKLLSSPGGRAAVVMR